MSSRIVRAIRDARVLVSSLKELPLDVGAQSTVMCLECSLAHFQERTFMAAKDFFGHRHQDTVIGEDHLDVWKPIPPGEKDATTQIDQADGVMAAVSYRAEHAPALARAILEAVGLDPRTVFQGDLPELTTPYSSPLQCPGGGL